MSRRNKMRTLFPSYLTAVSTEPTFNTRRLCRFRAVFIAFEPFRLYNAVSVFDFISPEAVALRSECR